MCIPGFLFMAHKHFSMEKIFGTSVLIPQNILLKSSTFNLYSKKSRIRETKHLSTDADSSTDAIGGWTKAKSAKKNTFFCAAILDHFQTKMFKC